MMEGTLVAILDAEKTLLIAFCSTLLMSRHTNTFLYKRARMAAHSDMQHCGPWGRQVGSLQSLM